MARVCDVCTKGPQSAQLVSHARNRVKRWVYPNVHKMSYILKSTGTRSIKRGSVCTKCVKAGKIEKVV